MLKHMSSSTVPVFRYPYGKSFEYIPISDITSTHTLVCIVGDATTKDFAHILSTVHEFNTPTLYISLLDAIRLLQLRLSLIHMSPATCEDLHCNIHEIDKAITLEMQKMLRTWYCARQIQRAWRQHRGLMGLPIEPHRGPNESYCDT